MGDFRDDKKTGKAKYDFGECYGIFEGELDSNEEFINRGVFEFPLQQVKYEGSFKSNMFHGKGKLIHLDTGNIFEGEFF